MTARRKRAPFGAPRGRTDTVFELRGSEKPEATLPFSPRVAFWRVDHQNQWKYIKTAQHVNPPPHLLLGRGGFLHLKTFLRFLRFSKGLNPTIVTRGWGGSRAWNLQKFLRWKNPPYPYYLVEQDLCNNLLYRHEVNCGPMDPAL